MAVFSYLWNSNRTRWLHSHAGTMREKIKKNSKFLWISSLLNSILIFIFTCSQVFLNYKQNWQLEYTFNKNVKQKGENHLKIFENLFVCLFVPLAPRKHLKWICILIKIKIWFALLCLLLYSHPVCSSGPIYLSPKLYSLHLIFCFLLLALIFLFIKQKQLSKRMENWNPTNKRMNERVRARRQRIHEH